MTVRSPLNAYVLQRLRDAFGEPDHSLGRDDHWSLRPGPHHAAINVLVDGTNEHPAVWVFDPHIKNDGVMRTSVRSPDELDDIIKEIQDRVKKAASMLSGDSSGLN